MKKIGVSLSDHRSSVQILFLDYRYFFPLIGIYQNTNFSSQSIYLASN